MKNDAVINIGGVDSLQWILDDEGNVKEPFNGLNIRIYDSITGHISSGGLDLSFNTEGGSGNALMSMKLANIPFDLIMTNMYATVEEMMDDDAKNVLNIMETMMVDAGVVLSQASLAMYIIEHYPSLKIKWSVTACYRDKPANWNAYISKVCEFADMIVLPPELNYDGTIMDHIDPSLYRKLELMTYDMCQLHCAYRAEHYALISIDTCNRCRGIEDREVETFLPHFCISVPDKRDRVFGDNQILPKLAKDYMTLGIRSFKIASRTLSDFEDLMPYIKRMKSVWANMYLDKECHVSNAYIKKICKVKK